MRMLALSAALVLAFASAANAVSVGELIGRCGDDAKVHCEGVGYGDPMQKCLDANYKKLSDSCRQVMDRIRGGEKVTLF